MSFQQFLAILKARKLIALSLFLLTVISALTVSLVLPKKYTATASMVIDVKSPDPISGMVLQGMMAPGYMATQVDILTSDRVAKKVIQMTGMDKSQELRSQWVESSEGDGTFEDWLTDLLLKKLEVKPARESNVLSVSFSSATPQFAALIANAFVQAYINTSLELRVEPARRFGALFEQQIKQQRDTLEKAQSKLSEYQKEHGLVATDERLDVENARLLELSSQLVAVQALTAESRSRKAQSGANTTEVLSNGLIAALKADLVRQDARLKELTSKYGPAHPLVTEAVANINELRARIDTEIGRVTSSIGTNNTVNLSREAQLRSALDYQREKLLELKAQRDEAQVLVRDVENAQKAYDALTARLMQINLEGQSNQTNVSILKVATPPADPSAPKIFLNLIIAIFVGTMLAVGMAMSIELNNRRLRHEEDISVALNQLVMVVIPKLDLSQARRNGGSSTALLETRKALKLPGTTQG